MNIVPLGDRVLVKPFSPEEMGGKTVSGIIIPDTLDKEKPEQGKVLAVGDGRIDDGVRIPISVNVGDTVIFSKYAYDEIKVEGEDYYMLKEDNILAIIR
ncbi:MAG: co-chaperone GroES [Candidatus Zambryskibacteria bacterium CG10_big_fil_rev_8_21_14_0_10_42_12]|uniref:Co-chaperonin GroES n=1 Tax=Candidatus Zambryskibacteria bacterium CG10_big_fil_rev_8_21_14_0_10_42_12 TaxID=1975115 RepID=A0A2H0QUS4_9BACT|nr:MAG: co-chaperone GroES [Candidatus Zambryskibacteria bacterium CG10_big_fil_rev_8_21_14_0_10_42_12]